ncbi:MAG TPA: hypothetical protein VEY95_11455 [Azospirillaceae bacterium]|nr:hypothetical protein [Azospirillaceae bacterium]
MTAPQSLAPNTQETLKFNAAAIDIGSSFNAANNSFKPKQPGLYQITASFAQLFTGEHSENLMGIGIRLNGTVVAAWQTHPRGDSGGDQMSATVTDLVQMNGTSDQVTVYGATNTGGSVSTSSEGTRLTAVRAG